MTALLEPPIAQDREPFSAVDLFCGAGGTSAGLYLAARELGLPVDLLAINHWNLAIDTHSANHPQARHLCESIEGVNPRKAVPGGHLKLLVGSPECVHFSNARGGKPMSDQSRATAWHVLRWAEALTVENILIENVAEFRTWGPLSGDGRPIPAKKGTYYRNFLRNLRVLGYTVSERILCAADYGDATTRRRLFVQARKGKRPNWPNPTHLPPEKLTGHLDLFGAKPWRTAREIINWSLPSRSIYGRKRPLAENTLRRIHAGLVKYSGLPFLIGQQSGAVPRLVDDPTPTVAGSGAISLIEPYLVVFRKHGDGASVDSPTPTICGAGTHLGLAQPFLMPHQHGTSGANVRSVDEPFPTVTGQSSDIFLSEPYFVALNHSRDDSRSYDLARPFPTVTSVDAWGMADPWLIPFHGEREGQADRCHSADEPIPTLGCSPTLGLCEPWIIRYHGSDETAHSIDAPLGAVTTRDRFALIHPALVRSGQLRELGEWVIVGWLDIRFRMLSYRELARAMSFPDEYVFVGTREQIVRQIGNAVPVQLARALCRCILSS